MVTTRFSATRLMLLRPQPADFEPKKESRIMSFNVTPVSLSLLAFSAFGIVACTITSGTVDDTGIRNVDPTPVVDVDSGTDASTPDATTLTCEGNLQGTTISGATPIVSASCQACLDANCCSALTTCFNKTGIDSSVSGNCDEIKGCYDSCATSADPLNCPAGCDSGNPSISTEYAAVRSCGTTSCASECQGIQPARN